MSAIRKRNLQPDQENIESFLGISIQFIRGIHPEYGG